LILNKETLMPRLAKNGTKILKTVHLVAVSCWVGGSAVLTLLNFSNDAAVSEGMLRGLLTASQLADFGILVPGALGCLATGLAFALLTPWGFFRHGWLTCKWLLTVACILSGTFLLGAWEEDMLAMSRTLGNAALADSAYLAARTKFLAASCVQFAVLAFMVAISVFKPQNRHQNRHQNRP
jgi:uncharacterized membrane protein